MDMCYDSYYEELIAADMGLNDFCHVDNTYKSCDGDCKDCDLHKEYIRSIEEFYCQGSEIE